VTLDTNEALINIPALQLTLHCDPVFVAQVKLDLTLWSGQLERGNADVFIADEDIGASR
jgi:hypothetical protein